MSSRPPRNEPWLPYVIVGGCALLALTVAAVGTLSLVSLGRDTPPDPTAKATQGTTLLIGPTPAPQATTVSIAPTASSGATPTAMTIPLLQTTLVPTGSSSREPTPRSTAASASASPTSASTRRPGVSTYSVRAGDTLGSIAAMHGVSVQTLLQVNQLSNPAMLRVGQELHIPSADGLLHEVKAGETVNALARLYGVSANDIAKHNSLDSSYSLRVGQLLVIPGATRPAEAPTSAPRTPTAAPATRVPASPTTTATRAQPTTTPQPTATATRQPSPTATRPPALPSAPSPTPRP